MPTAFSTYPTALDVGACISGRVVFGYTSWLWTGWFEQLHSRCKAADDHNGRTTDVGMNTTRSYDWDMGPLVQPLVATVPDWT